MRLQRIFPVVTAVLAILAVPAHASDKDKDHDDKDKHHHHHDSDDHHSNDYHNDYHDSHGYHEYHSGSNYYGVRRPVIIVQHERPVYVESRSYGSGSLEVDVQRGLAHRGYYRGPIDGDIGPGTRSSIRAWQADNGMPITGRVDGRLLNSLR